MKKLTLHLGLHRCASTLVQNMLRANRQVLAEEGIAVLLRSEMESDPTIDMRRWHRRGPRDPRMWGKVQSFADQLSRQDADHIVVSEENLIGLMPGREDWALYPLLPNLLHHIKALSSRFDLQLRFLLRSPDRFLESIYAFQVSRGLALDFKAFRARFPDGTFDWQHLEKIVAAAGLTDHAQFAMIDRETSSGLRDSIACKLGLPSLNWGGKGRSNPSLPPEALRLLLAVNKVGLFRDLEERKERLLPVFRSNEVVEPVLLSALLTRQEMTAVEQHFSTDVPVSFSDAERKAFLET